MFGFVTRVTRRVPLVEQKQLTRGGGGYLCSFIPVLNAVRVAQSLVFCVVFCILLFAVLSFFFWSLCCLLTHFGIFK